MLRRWSGWSKLNSVTRADHQRLINSAESENSVALLVHIREVTTWWGQALDWGPRQLNISKAYSGCYVLHCLLTGNVHHVQNTSLQTSLVSNTYDRNATLMWTWANYLSYRGYGIIHDLMYKHLEKLQNYARGQWLLNPIALFYLYPYLYFGDG